MFSFTVASFWNIVGLASMTLRKRWGEKKNVSYEDRNGIDPQMALVHQFRGWPWTEAPSSWGLEQESFQNGPQILSLFPHMHEDHPQESVCLQHGVLNNKTWKISSDEELFAQVLEDPKQND